MGERAPKQAAGREATGASRAGPGARPAVGVPSRTGEGLLPSLQRTVGNRDTVGIIRRMAVSVKDLGSGALSVETGGDFDANHTADGWADAVIRSGKRAPNPAVNTVVKDVSAFKQQVAAADYDNDVVALGGLRSVRGLKVADVELWQISTAQAKDDAASLAAEPAATKKTVHLKTRLSVADGKEKSRGNPTPSDKGPLFLVTGIHKVV